MNRMMPAPRTIFFSFEFIRHILFVFCCAVVAAFTFAALHLNDFLHKLNSVLDFRVKTSDRKSEILNLQSFKPMTGIEPVTPSLPRKCSTTELHGHNASLRRSVYSVIASSIKKEDCCVGEVCGGFAKNTKDATDAMALLCTKADVSAILVYA